ncbi:hypothetical protein QQZ08_005235 [Neonectria magnoliae]|uniref:Uncharacterized protein n=1 Tax=Neonectria magnoliae TaxID=2732573 RepID=A0ABR1I3Q7_9HYPO
MPSEKESKGTFASDKIEKIGDEYYYTDSKGSTTTVEATPEVVNAVNESNQAMANHPNPNVTFESMGITSQKK